jgi:hypothetical protein
MLQNSQNCFGLEQILHQLHYFASPSSSSFAIFSGEGSGEQSDNLCGAGYIPRRIYS